MILSEKHGFVYIKGRKVGSTSIEVMLSTLCGPHDIVTPITPIDEKSRLESTGRGAQNYGVDAATHQRFMSDVASLRGRRLAAVELPQGRYYNHMPLREVVAQFGPIPPPWTVFAVERSPYAKIVSQANMKLNFQRYRSSGKAMSTRSRQLRRALADAVASGAIEGVRNIDLYRDPQGRISLRVLKLENLEQDLARLMADLGISDYPVVGHYKRGMASESLDYTDLFSAADIATINACFVEEFSAFGYPMIG